MQKVRGFEVIEAYKDKNIQLPERSTLHSAGYDIQAAEEMVLESFWPNLIKYQLKQLKQWINKSDNETWSDKDDYLVKPTLIPTGLKAYMMDDEYLQIINRSSNPIKKSLILPNSIGIIDADYYNNPGNEGHIYVQMINYGLSPLHIKKGDRIAQGIFTKFLKVDNESEIDTIRTGGFGSSDKK